MRFPGYASPLFLAALSLLLSGCADEPHNPADFSVPGARSPELNSGADGRVYLSWQETRNRSTALRFATFDGHGWSAPVTVAEGSDWFVNAADFPSVTAFGDGLLAAHWLQKNGPGTYAYQVRMRISGDGGKIWNAPFTLHDDATLSEHGFVTLLPAGSGRFEAVWLDGRHTAGTDGDHEAHGAMSLRHALIDMTGAVLSQEEVDARTCDCCQTSAVTTPSGTLIAYRDRSEDEVRNVVVRHRDAAGWSDPVSLDREPWTIEACPVNGPSLAAQTANVAAAWFSGAAGKPRVLVAFSKDAGHSFTEPVRVDEGRPAGRVDVAVLDDGSALVSWLEMRDEGIALNLRRVEAGGRSGDVETVASLGEAAANTFPRMTRSGSRVFLAWTERDADVTLVRAVVRDAGAGRIR